MGGILKMAKHIIKAAASVNCNRGNGEEDVVKIIFAMARYILNKRKNTDKYTYTTFVPKSKEFRDVVCEMWKYTLMNPEDLPCVPIYEINKLEDGSYAEDIPRITIPVVSVQSHSQTPIFKSVFIDIIEDDNYKETVSWLDVMPSENQVRYIKNTSILCQQTYIELLDKYGVLEELDSFIYPEGSRV